MIKVKRLNGKEFVVNSDLIVYVEETPDTVITLTNGHKVVVTDTIDEIIDKTIAFRTKAVEYKRRVEGKEV